MALSVSRSFGSEAKLLLRSLSAGVLLFYMDAFTSLHRSIYDNTPQQATQHKVDGTVR